MGAAGWALDSISELPHVDFKFRDGAAESISVHTKFARSTALVALVLLKDREDKPLLEFADALGVKNIALVHLQNECFQLIFHVISLSRPMSL